MGWFVASKLGGLTNANLSDERRATLSDTNPAEYTTRQLASKVLIAVWSLSAFIIWALKVCLAVSYSRITYVVTRSRTIVSAFFLTPPFPCHFLD